MTRAQFLNDLYHRLESLTREQAEQHLTYYAEMLADRMEEGMSEEQAVESMEDLDTIARRILEEEGLPAAAPADPPAAPPAYPDASRIPGGGGTRAYQPPKKRNWRKPASALLWGLAILCAVISLSARLTRDSRAPTYYAETTDAVTTVEDVDSGVTQEALEEVVLSSGAASHEIPAEAVNALSVNWTSGAVEVASWSGDSISFSTDSGLFGVEWGQADDTLRLSQHGGDTLYLQIPAGTLGSLTISAASADVLVEDVNIDALDIATISGDVRAGWVNAAEIAVKTTSGDVYLDGLTADRLNVTTTSGDVDGSECCAYEFQAKSVSGKIEMDLRDAERVIVGTVSGGVDLSLPSLDPAAYVTLDSRSGDISLALPEDLGFELTFDTVSGDADMEADCTRLNGVYTRNGGGCAIYAVTVSGDLRVESW